MSRELSGQDLKRFYGEVNSVIWTLVQSVDNNDKLCGVMIIGELRVKALFLSIGSMGPQAKRTNF